MTTRRSTQGLLKLLETILREYFKKTHENDENCFTECTALLTEELLLQRQVDRDISRTIVQAIPIEGGNLLSSMHAMVALWSESSFVRKADNRNVLCLTASILTGLDRLDASQQLHGGEEQKASFLYSLSTRVSLLRASVKVWDSTLDSADQVARLEGMRVACRFSAITGHELTFPELVEAEKREEMEKQKAQRVLNRRRQ